MSYFSLVNNAGRSTITTLTDAGLRVADDTHPNFERIRDLAIAGEEVPSDLFDVERAVKERFESLSDRVSIKGGKVYVDYDEVDGRLAETIVKFVREDEDFRPLVNFLEKIMTNPNARSREQLYEWLVTHGFTIADDGDFIAYKGLNEDRTSIHSGPAIVNGEEFDGNVPNEEGSVIEISRSRVSADPNSACAFGLHAGNWRYASSFGRGVTARVKINPRDVVSVPNDSNHEKLRTCRYEVLDVVEAEDTSTVYRREGLDLSEGVEAEFDPNSLARGEYPGDEHVEYAWNIEGETGYYIVFSLADKGWQCTCPSFRYGSDWCKHIRSFDSFPQEKRV